MSTSKKPRVNNKVVYCVHIYIADDPLLCGVYDSEASLKSVISEESLPDMVHTVLVERRVLGAPLNHLSDVGNLQVHLAQEDILIIGKPKYLMEVLARDDFDIDETYLEDQCEYDVYRRRDAKFYSRNSLVWAARFGDLATVERLLQSDMDLDEVMVDAAVAAKVRKFSAILKRIVEVGEMIEERLPDEEEDEINELFHD
jgi:hypothetical protein